MLMDLGFVVSNSARRQGSNLLPAGTSCVRSTMKDAIMQKLLKWQASWRCKFLISFTGRALLYNMYVDGSCSHKLVTYQYCTCAHVQRGDVIPGRYWYDSLSRTNDFCAVRGLPSVGCYIASSVVTHQCTALQVTR